MAEPVSSLSPSAAHLFTTHGRSFLFDTTRRVAFELDAPGLSAARILLGQAGTAADAAPPDPAVEHALAELSSLQQKGHFRDVNPPSRPIPPDSIGIPFPMLSRQCNLRCRYCFLDPTDLPHMSREVMEAAADFIADRAAQSNLSYTLWLGNEAEVTAHLPQYFEFSKILADAGRRRGVVLTTEIPITNATLTHRPEVRSRLRELYTPGVETTNVSIDGPPEAHDALRVYPDGRGTYADVIRGMQHMREAGVGIAVSAVVTALFPDVSDIYFHFLDMGIGEIAVKPVRARPDEPHAIGRNLDAICAGYTRLIDRLLQLPDEKLLAALLAIIGYDATDYFARFFVRIAEGLPTQRRCNSWMGYISIGTDGHIYGCQPSIGIPDARIGSIWDGIDEPRVQQLVQSLHVSQRTPCNTCWARFLCGGGCMHQSYLRFSELSPADPDECTLNKHIIELAIYLHSELQRARPRVLAALPRQAKRAWNDAPPIACPRVDTPAGAAPVPPSLHRLPPITVRLADNLKRRLTDAHDDRTIEVRSAWEPTGLWLSLAARGGAAEDYWSSLDRIRLSLTLPRAITVWATQPVAPRLQHIAWDLSLRVSDGHLRYDRTPRREMEGQPVPGGRAAPESLGCAIFIPWQSVGVPHTPTDAADLDLQLTLLDSEGGHLDWAEAHTAAKLTLAPSTEAP